jgi:hypothetical protein
MIDGFGTAARAWCDLSWQVPRFGRSSFEVQQRDDDVGGPGSPCDSACAAAHLDRRPLTMRGSGASAFAASSATAQCRRGLADRAQSAGLTFAPDDITNLHLSTAVDGQTVLDWTIVVDQRCSTTRSARARAGTPAWLSATSSRSRHGRPRATAPITSGPMCCRRSASGSTASNTASITIADSIISRNIIGEGRAGTRLDRRPRRRRDRRQLHPDR